MKDASTNKGGVANTPPRINRNRVEEGRNQVQPQYEYSSPPHNISVSPHHDRRGGHDDMDRNRRYNDNNERNERVAVPSVSHGYVPDDRQPVLLPPPTFGYPMYNPGQGAYPLYPPINPLYNHQNYNANPYWSMTSLNSVNSRVSMDYEANRRYERFS